MEENDECRKMKYYISDYEIHQLDTSDSVARYQLSNSKLSVEVNVAVKNLLDFLCTKQAVSLEVAIEEYLALNEGLERDRLSSAVDTLCKKGLIQIGERADESIENSEVHRNRMPFLWWRKTLFLPDRHGKLFSNLRFLISKPAVILILLGFFSLDIWYIATIRLHPIPFSGGNLLDIAIVIGFLILATVVHEVFHVIAMRKFNAPMPEGVGIGIYWFSLALYTDTHSSLLLPRTQRVVISGVGILGQMLCIVLFSPLLLATGIGVFRDILLITNFLVFATFNPFLKLDGYWVVCDLLGVSNLQNKLLLAIKHHFTKKYFNPFSTYSRTVRSGIALYLVVFVLFFIAFLSSLAFYVFYLIMNADSAFISKTERLISGAHPDPKLGAFELVRDSLVLFTTFSGVIAVVAKLFAKKRKV